MPKNADRKKAIRDLMAQEEIPYSEAKTRLDQVAPSAPAGALVGYTTDNHAPVYLDWTEEHRQGAPAVSLFAGSPGSGTTQLALSLAHQIAESAPVVYIDTTDNRYSHDDFFRHAGGQIVSLDALADSPGCLDPLRLAPTPEAGIQMAVGIIRAVNLFGSRNKYEVDSYLYNAIGYGIEHGARSTGSALELAWESRQNHPELPQILPNLIYDDLKRQMWNPWFRVLVGLDSDPDVDEALAPLQQGNLILVRRGRRHLDVGAPGRREPNLEQRIAAVLIRMLTFACTRSVAARGGGTVILDSASGFLRSGANELEKIARVGLATNVSVLMFTGQVSDVAEANFESHLCRVGILHMQNPREAVAACALAGLDATEENIMLITHLPRHEDEHSPRRIYPKTGDPEAGRGSVVMYTDLDGRTSFVEVQLSDDFLYWTSTRPRDVDRRRAAAAAKDAQLTGQWP